MNTLDAKIAGLGILQSIISRMASNSFYIKGWDLTIFIGVIALKKDIIHYGNAIFLIDRNLNPQKIPLPKKNEWLFNTGCEP